MRSARCLYFGRSRKHLYRVAKVRGSEDQFRTRLCSYPKDAFSSALAAEIPYLERGEIGPWRARLDEAQHRGNAAAIPIFYIECAQAERDRAAAELTLTFVPPSGITDSTSDANWPRDWFVGLVARSFHEKENARNAFSAARAVVLPITQKLPDYPAGWSILGLIDAGLKDRSDAIAEGKHACDLLPLSKDAWDGPGLVTNLALIYAWIGEKDLALEQLELAAKIPAGVYYGDLKLSPKWDSLRDDPRFEKIIASLAPEGTTAW